MAPRVGVRDSQSTLFCVAFRVGVRDSQSTLFGVAPRVGVRLLLLLLYGPLSWLLQSGSRAKSFCFLSVAQGPYGGFSALTGGQWLIAPLGFGCCAPLCFARGAVLDIHFILAFLLFLFQWAEACVLQRWCKRGEVMYSCGLWSATTTSSCHDHRKHSCWCPQMANNISSQFHE